MRGEEIKKAVAEALEKAPGPRVPANPPAQSE